MNVSSICGISVRASTGADRNQKFPSATSGAARRRAAVDALTPASTPSRWNSPISCLNLSRGGSRNSFAERKCPELGNRHTTFRPSCRPNSQDTPLPRTTAIMVCPSRCSITGFHGTRLNPIPSSIMAKRPLVSRTFPARCHKRHPCGFKPGFPASESGVAARAFNMTRSNHV
jgi:hypothetical protein